MLDCFNFPKLPKADSGNMRQKEMEEMKAERNQRLVKTMLEGNARALLLHLAQPTFVCQICINICNTRLPPFPALFLSI